MIAYFKLGKRRGLSMEIKKDFGASPIFQKKYFNSEIIVDIPYTQFVYTPGNWIPIRRASNGNEQTGQISKSVKRISKR